MAPPVFICASDAGHDERSPMRVYGALWAMSTIAIEWTAGVGYPQDPAGGIGARLCTQIAFPLPPGALHNKPGLHNKVGVCTISLSVWAMRIRMVADHC